MSADRSTAQFVESEAESFTVVAAPPTTTPTNTPRPTATRRPSSPQPQPLPPTATPTATPADDTQGPLNPPRDDDNNPTATPTATPTLDPNQPTATPTATPTEEGNSGNQGDNNQGGNNQGSNDQGGNNQGGNNQGGNNQGGNDQGGNNQGGSNQGGNNQGGNNQGGNNQGGNNQGGSNQGGSNQGGNNQGGSNQGGSNQGGNNQGGGVGVKSFIGYPTPLPSYSPQQYQAPIAITIPELMNVRTGPGLIYDIVTTVPAGTQGYLYGIDPDDDWFHIELEGFDTRVWVYQDLSTVVGSLASVKLYTAAEIALLLSGSGGDGSVPLAITVPITMNVRTGPGLLYDVVGIVPKGTQGRIFGIDPENDWFQVELEGLDTLVWLYQDLTTVVGSLAWGQMGNRG